jgi:phosphatidate cytidylyltransferase
VTRVLSSIVLIAFVGGVVFFAPWWATVAVTALVAALAAFEMAGLSAAVGAPISKPVVMTAAAVLCAATAFTGDLISGGPLVPVLLALVVGAGLVTLGSGAPSPAVVTRAAMLVMAPLYVGVPLGALAWIHIGYGPWTMMFLLTVVALSDSTQYFAGRAFGRRKLAPSISPAKTIEGALGGLVAAVATGAVLAPMWVMGTTWIDGVMLGLILCAAGIAGDLFESLLKRSAGVKDSSSLIPGHGGVLDRIDGHLFAAPVFVLFLRYVA